MRCSERPTGHGAGFFRRVTPRAEHAAIPCQFRLVDVWARWVLGMALVSTPVWAQPADRLEGSSASEQTADGSSEPESMDALVPGDRAGGAASSEMLLDVQERIAASDFAGARVLLDTGELDEPDRLALSGFIALLEGDCERALPEFTRVLELRPSRLGVWLYVAQCELMQGDAARAAEAWARGVEAGRQLPDVWLLGAQIELAAGHRGESWRIAGAAGERFSDDERFDIHRRVMVQQLGLRWLPDLWRLEPLQPNRAPWDLAWQLHERVQGVRPDDDSALERSWAVAGTSESMSDRILRLVQGGEFTRALALALRVETTPDSPLCDALTQAALEVGDADAVREWMMCASAPWQQVARGWLAE